MPKQIAQGMHLANKDTHIEEYRCPDCDEPFRYTEWATPETKRADFEAHAKACKGAKNEQAA